MDSAGTHLANQVSRCLAQLQRPGYLGLFCPLGSEPDLLHPAPAWEGGLALPRCQSEGLAYASWRSDEAMSPDSCGIPAPQGPPLAAMAMGLLLIPALAIDSAGQRLGSGGGWYDRLRAQPSWRAVPTLAVLPECCSGVEIPSDPWDIPLQGWINESGLHWCDQTQC